MMHAKKVLSHAVGGIRYITVIYPLYNG